MFVASACSFIVKRGWCFFTVRDFPHSPILEIYTQLNSVNLLFVMFSIYFQIIFYDIYMFIYILKMGSNVF